MHIYLLQVLERDLAIFGFFIALGRSTKSFLSASGFDVIDDPLEGFIRYTSSPFKFILSSCRCDFAPMSCLQFNLIFVSGT